MKNIEIKKLLILAAAVLTLFAARHEIVAQATNNQTMRNTVSATDKKYLMKTATGSIYELASAKLAVERATKPAVKEYAQKLVDDHETFNQSLQQLAQSKGITLPTEMDAKDTSELSKLQSLNGAAFDREFIKEAVRINNEDINASKTEASRTKDSDIKSFLQQFSSVDKEHLRGATDLQTGDAAKPKQRS